MLCPFCGHAEDKVVDSTETFGGTSIRRRRECMGCGKRFTTYERVEGVPCRVVKKDGRREKFDRKKLLNGLIKACEKRPVKTSDLNNIVEGIEADLQNMPEREVSTRTIGRMIMDNLKLLDQVAYVRFASVYRQFADISEFQEEVRQLLDLKGRGDKQ